jgi:rare lipoprotein A
MRAAFSVALGLVLLSGCAHKRTARKAPPPPTRRAPSGRPVDTARKTPPPPPPIRPSNPDEKPSPLAAPEVLYVETGIASWYGHPYHGRIAANGERYDMEQMTAAHRTLPFDTWVHVVNLMNQKVVDVRITDRGPFIDGRIIDLSHAAARAIEMIGPGTAQVRLEITSMPETTRTGVYAVQVGAFRDKSNAERQRIRMAAKYGAARIVLRDGTPALWRVLVGAEKTEEGADSLRLKIHRESGERNGFVVRLDS